MARLVKRQQVNEITSKTTSRCAMMDPSLLLLVYLDIKQYNERKTNVDALIQIVKIVAVDGCCCFLLLEIWNILFGF